MAEMSREEIDLRKKLLYESANGLTEITAEESSRVEDYCGAYIAFLNACKTERECAVWTVEEAKKRGFKELKKGMTLQAGDKVYRLNRDKSAMLAVIGEEPLQAGVHVCAAHIDSPRLDLKPRPLYEDGEMALFKTHYYGGIRKYHWVAIPLELRGVIALKDGSNVTLVPEPGDPKLVITDLLPHLAARQNEKKLAEAFTGEDLNILVGGTPLANTVGTERIKLNILQLLNQKFGITEADFISAELEAVPAYPAVEIGLDRSFIGAYGHDDRVCAYAAVKAIFDAGPHTHTMVCMLADKEEVGSEGVSAMQCQAFDMFMRDLCEGMGQDLDVCFTHSDCLSADVTAAFDPNYPDVFDKQNAARVNHGVGLCKYTGSKGKSRSSDAAAELVGKVRKILDEQCVAWQMAELGKVDAGGGGTVAKFMARRNMDVLDAGVPVLSMHSPFEVVAKYDCYMTYKAMKAFFEA